MCNHDDLIFAEPKNPIRLPDLTLEIFKFSGNAYRLFHWRCSLCGKFVSASYVKSINKIFSVLRTETTSRSRGCVTVLK